MVPVSVRAGMERGALGHPDAAPAAGEDPAVALPAGGADALADELDGRSRGSCLVLHSAAVAGEPFVPDLAADIARLGEAVVLASLDEALCASLIRPTDSPMWFRRHPIVRRVLSQRLRLPPVAII